MIRDLDYRKKYGIVFCKVKAGHYRVFMYPVDGQNILLLRVELGFVIRDYSKVGWIFVPRDRSKYHNTVGDTRCAAIEAAYHFEFSFFPDQKEVK